MAVCQYSSERRPLAGLGKSAKARAAAEVAQKVAEEVAREFEQEVGGKGQTCSTDGQVDATVNALAQSAPAHDESESWVFTPTANAARRQVEDYRPPRYVVVGRGPSTGQRCRC